MRVFAFKVSLLDNYSRLQVRHMSGQPKPFSVWFKVKTMSFSSINTQIKNRSCISKTRFSQAKKYLKLDVSKCGLAILYSIETELRTDEQA